MTLQEIFDRVVTHLLTQKKRSRKPVSRKHADYVCAYRNPDGLMCAIGCLINDNAYTPDLEGHVVSSKPVLNALRQSGLTQLENPAYRHLLRNLQRIHDMEPTSAWHGALKRVARVYNLAFNPPPETDA